MSLDRSLGLGMGLFMAVMFAAVSAAQASFGFLWSGGHARRLPPHRDPRTIHKYTDQGLEGLRKLGDKLADDLIVTIAERGDGAVEEFYRLLLTKKSFDVDDEDYAGLDYIDDLRGFDLAVKELGIGSKARLTRAGKFFKLHLFKIMVILSTSSLLEAYACANGVQVLSRTGYLSKDTNRRLKETLQFVMYVNEPNAFEEMQGGKGLAAIMRVRLMHGCIRWIIRKRDADWRDDVWGAPINGEDLLGMLVGFSAVVISGLSELDVTLTTEEVEDHIYLWNEVGRLLGAGTKWLPADLGEALALVGAVKSRQQRYSLEGESMTKALLAYHRAVLGDLVDVATGAMRRLAGDYICDMLGVPDSEYADRSWMHDFVFRVLLWWGDKLITYDGLDVRDVTTGKLQKYEAYDIPRSLWSVVFPESYA